MSRLRNMVRILIKTWFYLSSFMPLYLLLIIQNIVIRDTSRNFLNTKQILQQFYDSKPESLFWGITFVLILFSLFFIIAFKKIWLSAEGTPGKLEDSSLERGDILGYIATYVIPLLAMDISSYRSLTINFLLFTLIGIFYVADNQLFMNPIFNLLGYRIFLSGDNVYITKLSRQQLKDIIDDQEVILKINILETIFIIKENY